MMAVIDDRHLPASCTDSSSILFIECFALTNETYAWAFIDHMLAELVSAASFALAIYVPVRRWFEAQTKQIKRRKRNKYRAGRNSLASSKNRLDRGGTNVTEKQHIIIKGVKEGLVFLLDDDCEFARFSMSFSISWKKRINSCSPARSFTSM